MSTAQSDDATPVFNRWLVVVGAILIQLCLGAIYSWSVFTPPLVAEHTGDVVDIYSAARLEVDAQQYEVLKATKKTYDEAVQQLAEFDRRADTEAATAEERAAQEQKRDSALEELDSLAAAAGITETVERLTPALSKAQTQAIFSAGLAAFAVVMVIAGRLMPSWGPRRLAIAGGLVLGLGYVLAGLFGGTDFVRLFIFIGLIGGAGIGLAYVVPIAVGMRWFPDKKGLVTGLAVAGFGFGATLWVKLAGSWGHLIANQGVSGTFIIYGIVFALACIVGAIWMIYPPENWKPVGWEPPQALEGQAPAMGTVDFTSGQMLRTLQFWMIWLCFVIGAGAGLMAIGLMKLFPMEALEASGIERVVASGIAGTAMGIYYALFNGFGRIAWGWISDRTGRRAAIVSMLGIQGVIVILFQWMAGQEYLLYLGAALIGFNFGGNFALFPTITADTFGGKHLAQNYGWVFLAYGVGGILFPILGGRLGDMGNFPLAFTISGILCLVAAGIAYMIRPPEAPTAAAQ